MSAPMRKPRKSTRRSLRFEEEAELTPRNVIEGMLSVQDTAVPIARALSRLLPPPVSSSKKRPRKPSLGVPSVESLADNTTPRSNIQALLQHEPERTAVVAHDHVNKSYSRGSMPNMEDVDINQVDFVPVPVESSSVPGEQLSSRKQPRKLRQLQISLKTPTVQKSPGRNLQKRKAAGELVFSPGQPEDDPTPQPSPDESQEKAVSGRVARSGKRRKETDEEGDGNHLSRREEKEQEEMQEEGAVEGAEEQSLPRQEGELSPKRSRKSTPRMYSRPSEAGAAIANVSQVRQVSVVISPIDVSQSRKLSAEELDGSRAGGSQRKDRSTGSLAKCSHDSLVENSEVEDSLNLEDSLPVLRSLQSSKGTPHPSKSALSFQSTRSTLTKDKLSFSAGETTPASRSDTKGGRGSRGEGGFKSPGASRSEPKSPEAHRTLNFSQQTAGEASPKLAGHRSMRAAQGASLNAADTLSTTNLDFAPALSSTRRETGFLLSRDQTEPMEVSQQDVSQQSAGPPTLPSSPAKRGRTPRHASQVPTPHHSGSKETEKSLEKTHQHPPKTADLSSSKSDLSPQIPIRNRSDQRKDAFASAKEDIASIPSSSGRKPRTPVKRKSAEEDNTSVPSSSGRKPRTPVKRKSDVSGSPTSAGKLPSASVSEGRVSAWVQAQTSGEHSNSTPAPSTSRQSTLTSTGRREMRTPVSASRRTTTFVQTTLPYTSSKSVAETPLISPIRGDPSGNFGDSLGSREWSPSLQSPHVSPARSRQTSKTQPDSAVRSGRASKSQLDSPVRSGRASKTQPDSPVRSGRASKSQPDLPVRSGWASKDQRNPNSMQKSSQAEQSALNKTSQQASGSQSLMSRTLAQQKAARKEKKPRKKKVKNPNEHIPLSTIKSVFSHFTNRRVSPDAFLEVERVSVLFWKHVAEDLEAYALHRHRNSISEDDIKLLMYRQRFVTDEHSFNAAVENLLPSELRRQLIPIARSGNRIEI